MAAERMLFLGESPPVPGWEIFNRSGKPGSSTGQSDNLSRYGAETFAVLYATDALEHSDASGPALATLREWHRVIVPGGLLMISVPDLAVIGTLLNQPVTLETQVELAQLAARTSCWTSAIIAVYLEAVGFRNVRRAESLKLFNVSDRQVLGRRVMLNVLADRR